MLLYPDLSLPPSPLLLAFPSFFSALHAEARIKEIRFALSLNTSNNGNNLLELKSALWPKQIKHRLGNALQSFGPQTCKGCFCARLILLLLLADNKQPESPPVTCAVTPSAAGGAVFKHNNSQKGCLHRGAAKKHLCTKVAAFKQAGRRDTVTTSKQSLENKAAMQPGPTEQIEQMSSHNCPLFWYLDHFHVAHT